jgi:hypothetical protein
MIMDVLLTKIIMGSLLLNLQLGAMKSMAVCCFSFCNSTFRGVQHPLLLMQLGVAHPMPKCLSFFGLLDFDIA